MLATYIRNYNYFTIADFKENDTQLIIKYDERNFCNIEQYLPLMEHLL